MILCYNKWNEEKYIIKRVNRFTNKTLLSHREVTVQWPVLYKFFI